MNATSLLSGIRGLSPEMLASRLSPRLPQAAAWTLALLLGVQAALIVRSLISRPAAVSAAIPADAAPAPALRPIDVQGIVNAHLFGVAAPGEEPAGDPTDAPRTSLTLVLAGTIAAEDPQRGFGIIGETAANAKVYSVGDTVPGGVRLHAVYRDRVILERSGQLEALLLPRQFEGGATSSAPPPIAGAAPAAETRLADRVRRMIAQDPGLVSEIMRPQPVFANGQQRGYRVYPGRNRQQFAQLGLKPGDLVLSVNGTPLDDPARGMEIFRTIGSASQVRVTVERNGRPQELVLNMAQLANQAQALGSGSENMVPMDQAAPMPPDPTEE